jgi:hypothetical protein
MSGAKKSPYDLPSDSAGSRVREDIIEYGFIGKLQGLKYDYETDNTNCANLEKNFREKFEALNRVGLSDSEIARLVSEDYADKVIGTIIQNFGFELDAIRKKQRNEFIQHSISLSLR